MSEEICRPGGIHTGQLQNRAGTLEISYPDYQAKPRWNHERWQKRNGRDWFNAYPNPISLIRKPEIMIGMTTQNACVLHFIPMHWKSRHEIGQRKPLALQCLIQFAHWHILPLCNNRCYFLSWLTFSRLAQDSWHYGKILSCWDSVSLHCTNDQNTNL